MCRGCRSMNINSQHFLVSSFCVITFILHSYCYHGMGIFSCFLFPYFYFLSFVFPRSMPFHFEMNTHFALDVKIRNLKYVLFVLLCAVFEGSTSLL